MIGHETNRPEPDPRRRTKLYGTDPPPPCPWFVPVDTPFHRTHPKGVVPETCPDTELSSVPPETLNRQTLLRTKKGEILVPKI